MYKSNIKEECGIFGVFGHPDSAALTALGLHALQHRGQESAGIVSFDGKHFNAERHLGLVGDHFTNASVINRLPGNSALGHVRYSTTGSTTIKNIQPLFADLLGGGIACAHNGNLTNGRDLRKKLVKKGSIFQSTTDTEAFIHLIAQSEETLVVKKIIDALYQMEGAYSLGVLTNKKLIGIRDPVGIRPLVLGDLNGSKIIASETCALDIIGAKFIRDVENGEIIVIDENGIKSFKPFKQSKARLDIFEYIYFARPDSIVGGKNVYECRKSLGRQLAKEYNTDADIVIPVPDSGVPAGLGFAESSGIAFELGITRNHYVGRTFIEPTQTIRQLGIKLKHNANPINIKNKRIVLIDDSIVRGTTAIKIVKMIREAGAAEVHMGVSSPPILFPDFYGIDTPTHNELIATNNPVEEIRKILDLDTIHFLSLDGLYKAMGHKNRNNTIPQYTDHCFTGDYPTDLKDRDGGSLSKQLSFLHEKI